MAFFRGEEGSVKFANDATSNTAATIVSTTGWSLDITKDTLECTSHGDKSRKYVGGLISGTGTVDFLYTAADSSDSSDTSIAATGKLLADILEEEDAGDAQFELFLDSSGAKKVEFTGIITGTSVSATTGDLETVSVSFQTSGTIDGAALH
tara:strand:+ start:20 stop:472 length:453 start_codon:yes stop_codon:yes gene_type:complete